MKKRIVKAISCIAAVIITLNLFVTITHARTYNDTQGRWMETFVDKMTELDIMFSSSTTYFYPGNNFTRKEAARSISMLFKETTLSASPHPFTDVSYTNSYSKYIKWVYDNGVMGGTDSTTFSPDLYIKRQDMCVALYNLYFIRIGVPTSCSYYSKITYSDDSQISAYAKDKVYFMQSIGVIGADGNAFRPKDPLTRGEASSMLYKLWNFSMILSTPQQKQIKSNWCWAACAKIMAEYRYPGSKTQTQIADFIKGGANVTANANELANGATWAAYYNVNHGSDGVWSSYEIMNSIAHYKPVVVLGGKYDSNGNKIYGHFMVCIGFAKNFQNIDESNLFIYDVAANAPNNGYYWMTYNEFKNGLNVNIDNRIYSHTAFSY